MSHKNVRQHIDMQNKSVRGRPVLYNVGEKLHLEMDRWTMMDQIIKVLERLWSFIGSKNRDNKLTTL